MPEANWRNDAQNKCVEVIQKGFHLMPEVLSVGLQPRLLHHHLLTWSVVKYWKAQTPHSGNSKFSMSFPFCMSTVIGATLCLSVATSCAETACWCKGANLRSRNSIACIFGSQRVQIVFSLAIFLLNSWCPPVLINNHQQASTISAIIMNN